MVARPLLFALAYTSLFAQCDDAPFSVKWAKRHSEAVFQGTVEGFKGPFDNRIVVFRVNRVWKGRVGRTFEMPAIETDGSLCTAFWRGQLAPGNELVVFASRILLPRSGEYFPIRQKSVLVSRATDMAQLGRGHKPR